MAAAAEALLDADLTPLEFAILAYVNKRTGEPDIDQIGLSARLGVDRNTTSLLVERLEARGLLERRINGDDRRARLLRLTLKGDKLHLALTPRTVASQQRLLKVLAPDLLVRVIEGNRTLARPGAGRRKRPSAGLTMRVRVR
jgi:DNA-binding MarR family transcriptional regulator